MKHILTLIAIIAFTKSSVAQYSQDALRFSQTQSGSTSRIKAVGNAGTAIGGDISNISGNPAGLGFFTQNEASFTPEFNGSKVSSNYLGFGKNGSNNTINASNGSIVIYNRLNTSRGADKTKGWLSLNYGIGYSRTANYYENVLYGGHNNTNSITDYYAEQANSFDVVEGSLAGWAFRHNLIDNYGTDALPDYRSNTYTGAEQASATKRIGGQSEVNFSMGANYSNKLYLGFGFGISTLRYRSTSTFNETGLASVLENDVPVDRNYNTTFSQFQETKGTGFNAKLGLIYKPVDAIRLGFVFTSPTFYNIDDTYSEGLDTRLSSGKSYGDGSPEYQLNYDLLTPLKVAGGIAFFIKQYGFITGDAEYINYGSARLMDNDDYSSSFDNDNIKKLYRSAVNLHVGGEFKPVRFIALRGGYGIQGNPMKNNGGQVKTATAGLGYRAGSYYIDATYAHVTGSQTVFPYEITSGSPGATLNRTYSNVFLTVGFRY